MKQTIFLFSMLISTAVFAKATVLKLRGDVTFGGKKVSEKSILRGAGEIQTKGRGFILMRLEDSQSVIAIRYDSKVFLNVSQKKQLPKVKLEFGHMEWKTGSGGKGNSGSIQTENMLVELHDTTVYANKDKILRETEVIVFEGESQVTSIADAKETKLLGKNGWAGIGGRFGAHLTTYTLPPEFIAIASEWLPIE